jgi:hypothetical protein
VHRAEGPRAEGGTDVVGSAAADVRGEANASVEAVHVGGGRGTVVEGVGGGDSHCGLGHCGQVRQRRDWCIAAGVVVGRGWQDDEAAAARYGAQGIEVQDLREVENGAGFAGDAFFYGEGAAGCAGSMEGV